jgi:hypothetical protein
MSGSHESHDNHAASGPVAYEPPKDVDNMVLFVPMVLGITIAVTTVMAVIWF